MSDNIKLVFTYSIATLLIVGGLLFLYLSRLDDPTNSNTAALIPLIAGFVGAAVQFVFSRETQTSTARQVERSYAAGISSQPTTTVTSGPPATATVTPADPIVPPAP